MYTIDHSSFPIRDRGSNKKSLIFSPDAYKLTLFHKLYILQYISLIKDYNNGLTSFEVTRQTFEEQKSEQSVKCTFDFVKYEMP